MADAVQQLVGMPNLPLTTALKGTTAKIGTEPIGPGQLEPALQELRGAETAAQERMLTAGAAEAKAQREEEAKKLDITARTAREQKAAIEALPEQEIAKQARKEAEAMKFSPTRDNAQDLAGLFSLIGVIGMVVGKTNAQAAMSAMDGMAKGYQQGRADLYKQQSTEFDKNFKAMQMKLQQAEKDLEKAIQLKKYDFQAGEAEAMAALARSESPLLKATYEKQGAVKALELLKDTRKDLTDAVNRYNDLSEKAYKRQFEEKKFKSEQAHRTAMAAARGQIFQGTDGKMYSYDPSSQKVTPVELPEGVTLAKPGVAGKGAGEFPKDKETNNEHRFRYSALENVQDVLDDLKKPEVRKLIGPQNQFTPDVLLNLQKGFPELAQKLARFQSEEFKIGGKALTASEQKILGPIYNWRGLTADALEANLKEAVRAMGKEQQYLENRFPGLKSIDYGAGMVRPSAATITSGTKSFATAEEAQAAADRGEIEPGDRITVGGESGVWE